MNIKRNVFKFAVVFAVVIIIGIGISFMSKSLDLDKSTDGIIIMTEDGNVIDRCGIFDTYVEIKEDNVIITGTAENDIMLALEGDAKDITLKNLEQDVFGIEIYMSEKRNGTIVFEGQNTICEIYAFKDCEVTAQSQNDELLVTKCIDFDGNNGKISGGKIKTSYLSAYGDLFIEGQTDIYIGEIRNFMFEKNMDARLEAYDNLYIDLAEGGRIYAAGSKSHNVPVSAIESINIADGTSIESPDKAQILIKDAGYGKECMICDNDGNVAKYVIIKSDK